MRSASSRSTDFTLAWHSFGERSGPFQLLHDSDQRTDQQNVNVILELVTGVCWNGRRSFLSKVMGIYCAATMDAVVR